MIQSDTGNNVCKERTRGVGCVAVQPPLVPPGRFGRLRSIVWSKGPVSLALFYNNCSRFGKKTYFCDGVIFWESRGKASFGCRDRIDVGGDPGESRPSVRTPAAVRGFQLRTGHTKQVSRQHLISDFPLLLFWISLFLSYICLDWVVQGFKQGNTWFQELLGGKVKICDCHT